MCGNTGLCGMLRHGEEWMIRNNGTHSSQRLCREMLPSVINSVKTPNKERHLQTVVDKGAWPCPCPRSLFDFCNRAGGVLFLLPPTTVEFRGTHKEEFREGLPVLGFMPTQLKLINPQMPRTARVVQFVSPLPLGKDYHCHASGASYTFTQHLSPSAS